MKLETRQRLEGLKARLDNTIEEGRNDQYTHWHRDPYWKAVLLKECCGVINQSNTICDRNANKLLDEIEYCLNPSVAGMEMDLMSFNNTTREVYTPMTHLLRKVTQGMLGPSTLQEFGMFTIGSRLKSDMNTFLEKVDAIETEDQASECFTPNHQNIKKAI